jgi:hypothetical protein
MPPLSIFSYVLVAVAQGLYGLIVLIAFWRRSRQVGWQPENG